MKPIRATGAVVGVTAVPHFWSSSYAQEEPANDRLNVGTIGTSISTDRYTGRSGPSAKSVLPHRPEGPAPVGRWTLRREVTVLTISAPGR